MGHPSRRPLVLRVDRERTGCGGRTDRLVAINGDEGRAVLGIFQWRDGGKPCLARAHADTVQFSSRVIDTAAHADWCLMSTSRRARDVERLILEEKPPSRLS